MPNKYFELPKDPAANIPLHFDWSEWLEDGDTITDSVWSVPAGITAGSDSFTTTVATIWVTGGTAGEYRFRNTVTTAAGLIDRRSVYVLVMDR